MARIMGDELSERRVGEIDAWCQRHEIACLYFLARADHPETTTTAEAYDFHLTDVRLTFEREALAITELPRHEALIRPSRPEEIPVLQAIARQNHHDTRFYFDQRFPRQGCDELYASWIANACRGNAGVVFVAEVDGRAAGYTSCRLAGDGLGVLGLVGISGTARGKALGPALVHTAVEWLGQHGAARVQVATQARNEAGQRLYQRCGFVTRHVQVWYHKWYLSPELAW
ncbi:MAG TPA: GNAT family N-acetyltransferase [Chloroflexota bacterium]